MRRDRPIVFVIAATLAASTASAAPVVSLTWEAMPGALGYSVEVATTADFAAPVLRADTEKASYDWSFLPEREYHWRVRARYSFGRQGEWSGARAIPQAVWPVTVDAASQELVCGVEDCRVTLAFRTSRAIDEYHVEVAHDDEFTQLVAEIRTRTGPVEFTADRTGTYFCRIAATDVVGRAVAPAAPARIVVKPAAPVTLAPDPGTRILAGDVLFRWKLPALALSSRIEIVRLPDGAAITEAAPGASFVWSVREPGSYAWRVRAVGEEAAVGPPSDYASFEIEPILVAGPAEIAGLRNSGPGSVAAEDVPLSALLAAPDGRASLDVGFGWRSNVAGASGPSPVIGGSWAISDRYSAAVITSTLRARRAEVMEAGFTGRLAQTLRGDRAVFLGAGPVLQAVRAQPGAVGESGFTVGAMASFTVSGPIRSGEWFAAIDARAGQWNGEQSRLSTGGFLMSAGVRFGR